MNNCKLHLTKIHLRCIKAGFKEVSTLSLPDGHKQEVIVFTQKGLFILGQVTPFGTVIIHEAVYSSNVLLNYVAVHESAHTRQWYRHFMYVLMPLWLGGLCAVFVSIMMLFSSIAHRNANFLIAFIICLAIAVVLVCIPSAFSWFVEFNADCQAIKLLGISTILKARDDAYNLSKPNLWITIYNRMTHPPLRFTFWFGRLIYPKLRNMDNPWAAPDK